MFIRSVTLLITVVAAQSCASRSNTPSLSDAGNDTAFAALQERGQQAMGVDQYSWTHRFDALPDGGRVELQGPAGDTAGITRVRAHMRDIAQAFKAGDFSTPLFVHMKTVPGTKVMAEKRSVIQYEARDLPRGAELRIRTSDPVAIQAIHEFMSFQRSDHRAGGHAHTDSAAGGSSFRR
jgi:hypothetical protein